jgi:hypothetical protein
VRDIKAGEQLFEDYATFSHPAFLYPLLEKYNCAPDYYELPAEKDRSDFVYNLNYVI